MKTNGGFLVTKLKQLGDRIFEKILRNPFSKLFYFGDKKPAICFHTKAPI